MVARRARWASWVALSVTAAAWPPADARGQALQYPATRRDSVVDDYPGTRIADPYRWLERLDDPATRDWLRAQRQLTTRYLDQLGNREPIHRRLAALWSFRRTDVPWREAGRIFFQEHAGTERQPVLYELDEVGGTPRVVLDPQRLSPDGSIAVGDYAVSPDGRWLAYSTSVGGADAADTKVRNLVTGRDEDDVVRGTLGTACWTADGGGFFYARSRAGAPDPNAPPRLEKELYYHLLGAPPTRDRLLHRWTDNSRWLYCMLSDDGRWAIAVAERGATASMHVMDLGDPRAPNLDAPFVPLLSDRDAHHTPMGTVGDTLFVFTDLGAPRGCVIALDLTAGDRAPPRAVIPESSDVLEWATVAGDRLAVHYLADVRSRLHLFRLDGLPDREVPLPGIGAIEWPVNGRHLAPELWYAFASFTQPGTVYRHDLITGISTPFRPPRVPIDTCAYQTRQVFYPSKDGTRVPMFITTRRDLELNGANPVFLTGYGGYGTVVSPSYHPDVPLWLDLGGVYAVANLRGGGEYGEEWHRAGSLDRKQNTFDDFIAAAEYLIAQRYTAAGKIAIYGHSNGGLLVGAVLVQRPDLFGVALPDAGHYDMLRYHRFTAGAGWIPEYGSPDDPAAFPALRAYSPLHNVVAGTCYPATLLLTADHDDRVVPSHAYKFAATLQAAQACPHPILLRVAENASHGYASRAEAIAERTDLWAFTLAQLGVPAARRLEPGRRVRSCPGA